MDDKDSSASRSERLPLSRERIIEVAIRLVDENGLAGLNMRRLGAELGVEAMALYRHVNGREDLLEAMVDALTSSVQLSDDMDLGPGGGWQSYLQRLAHTVRDLAHAHPQLFPMVATRHPAAPWLRPPLRSLELVEDFISLLLRHGFSDEQAVAAYRSFTSFLIGQLLLGVAQRGGSVMAEEPLDEGDATVPQHEVDPADFPEVTRLESKLSEDRSDEEFEAALENLLDRIDALVSQ